MEQGRDVTELLQWYMSVGGVAAASVLVAQFIVKTLFTSVPVLKAIPLVLHVMWIAAAGTWFAHSVLGTLEGEGLALLITQSVTTALVSIGMYNFVTNLGKPLSDTGGDEVPRTLFGARKFVGILLVGATLTASACSAKVGGQQVQLSPEGALAFRANQLVSSLRTLTRPDGASPVEQLVQARVITVDEGIAVAGVIRDAMLGAVDLATVLEAVDAAVDVTAREEGLRKAGELLWRISSDLQRATLHVGTEAGRAQVLQMLSVSAQLVLTIGSVFPAGTIG